MMNPTIYVTNWSSRKLHGPGRRYTIMARPRRWEHGDGCVSVLVPSGRDLRDVRDGFLTKLAYRDRYVEKIVCTSREYLSYAIGPGMLYAFDPEHPDNEWPVSDGDTLCCACSREAAARGECHRVWAAELLVEAGWRVVLDGEEVVQ